MSTTIRNGGLKIRRVSRTNLTGGNHATPTDNIFITKVQAFPNLRVKNVAVKDNVATRPDMPTTCASQILVDYRSPFEAEVLTKLRSHGEFFVFGKTKMDEFGMGSHSIQSSWGPAWRDSPLLRDYSPGGSSGGSAIAVADNYCDLGIGTDTGGSVRLPAAYTGVVGFKPSYGLISRRGVVPYANSLDTVGFLTKSVLASEGYFRQAMGHDVQDPTSLSRKERERVFDGLGHQQSIFKSHRSMETKSLEFPSWLKELTVGYPLEYNIKEINPEILQVWKFTLKLLRKVGVKVVPVSLPTTKHALSAYYVIAPAEASSNLAKFDGIRYGCPSNTIKKFDDPLFSSTRGEKLGPEVRRRILLGSYTLSSKAIDNYFIKAQKVRRLVQRDFDAVFKAPNILREPEQFDISLMHEDVPMKDKSGPERVDFIICPTAPSYPPELNQVQEEKPVETYMNDVFTVPASLAGLPAISIPVHLIKRRMFAVGMQIIGQYGTDFGVLRLARQLERLIGQYENSHFP
ncbi:Glutamyl-tRNA(Gln) amidotransferase subunit A [Podosphaera aphanis]|nr:Glutamyl-tRNA(Gln) amidotransferase subunit A [Podosphaera aphanis]